MATSRTGFGRLGDDESALTSSQTGAAKLRKFEPWVLRADKRAVIANGLEAFEIGLDSLLHVLIERALFGAELRRRDQGQSHKGLLLGMGVDAQNGARL